MNTVGRKKWPEWLKQVVGDRKCIEIKEHKGRYYASKFKSVWDKKLKRPRKVSEYLGAVTQQGIRSRESMLKGVYEFGHVAFVQHVLEKNGVLPLMRKIFPDWKVLLAFAMNRLIDPRPIKSMGSWCEKTYLIKQHSVPDSPKTIARVLEGVGGDWKSQAMFFDGLKKDGERIVYDGSVIFSASKENPILEVGYNKDELLVPKANIVLAFSHERFFPVFLRTLPGTIHEIATMDVLIEELGRDIILVLDKGFTSEPLCEKLNEKKVRFIIPLKRNSKKINYAIPSDSFFMYRNRPIKYGAYQQDRFFIYVYEDIALKHEEEKEYYTLLSKGHKVEFKEQWAGKISLLSNMQLPPKEIYEMWKSRGEIEKAFDVLQNMLDTDRPYVRKEHTFRGYLFATFIGLIAYYLILRMLKDAKLNDKTSVADLMLELSKLYVLDIKGKEVMSEKTKRLRKIMNALGVEFEDLITKKLPS